MSIGWRIAEAGAGVLAWLNNSTAMGGPHYGRGTEGEQQQAEQARNATVTVQAENNGEGRTDVDVVVNQGSAK